MNIFSTKLSIYNEILNPISANGKEIEEIDYVYNSSNNFLTPSTIERKTLPTSPEENYILPITKANNCLNSNKLNQRHSSILFKVKEKASLFLPIQDIFNLIFKIMNKQDDMLNEAELYELINSTNPNNINSNKIEMPIEKKQTKKLCNSIPNRFIKCPKCDKLLSCNQGLGGHMSRKHAGLSEKFKNAKEVREKRKEDRIKLIVSKIKYFNEINLNYIELKKTKEGRKEIKRNLNRFKLKKIKQEITIEEIDNFIKSYNIKDA